MADNTMCISKNLEQRGFFFLTVAQIENSLNGKWIMVWIHYKHDVAEYAASWKNVKTFG